MTPPPHPCATLSLPCRRYAWRTCRRQRCCRFGWCVPHAAAFPDTAWTCLAPEGENSVSGAVGWPHPVGNLTVRADDDDEEPDFSSPVTGGWPRMAAQRPVMQALTYTHTAPHAPPPPVVLVPPAARVAGKEHSPPNVFTVLPNPAGGATARAAALAVLQDMRNNSFVDLRTRALSIDINVYVCSTR